VHLHVSVIQADSNKWMHLTRIVDKDTSICQPVIHNNTQFPIIKLKKVLTAEGSLESSKVVQLATTLSGSAF